jgi:proteic killer suppression protein
MTLSGGSGAWRKHRVEPREKRGLRRIDLQRANRHHQSPSAELTGRAVNQQATTTMLERSGMTILSYRLAYIRYCAVTIRPLDSSCMEVEFDAKQLDRLETDREFTAGWPPAVVRGYRKALQAIRAAIDERDLYALRGLRFEKLKGKLQGKHSLRINDQWRLMVEIRGEAPRKRIGVVGIVDYH